MKIRITLGLLLATLTAGCMETKPDYGVETGLRLSIAAKRQVWAVAPVLNMSGQRHVDPLLQADLLYQQLQQVDGLTVVPVNRVVEVYTTLRIDLVKGIQSEEQAALVCNLLGCDGLAVATVTLYDPYYPPKMGAALQVFKPNGSYARARDVDPRELARRSAPSSNESLPSKATFVQAVGMFDSANGSVLEAAMRYAAGRNDPVGAYGAKEYLVDMDRYSGFVYHSLVAGVLAKMEREAAAIAVKPK